MFVPESIILLNEQQQAFVGHREGPAALLAVPGSGKTTTMVCRTAALIQSGVPAQRILTMTFTKAAAMDMPRRYAELFGTSEEMPLFSTIHSFSLQWIKHYCRVRRRPMPVIMPESGVRGGTVPSGSVPGRLELLTQLHRQLVGGRLGEDMLEALSMAISLAKNTMQPPETAVKLLDRNVKGFGVVFKAYEETKKERRLVDFDDMLTVFHRILTMDEGMLGEVRGHYDYIQVDEAQDSSQIQHAIIDLVAQPKNNIVLIGDEDQSIYVWRGAHPSGLLGFSERYPDAKVFLMETNYRSRAEIVRLADRFIRANTERTLKNLVAGRLFPLEQATDGGRERKAGEEIRIVRVRNLSEQYRHIRTVLGEHTQMQTAILYRNNRSVYGVADMLDRSGLSFRLRDFKDTLFSHWITRDIRAFVRLLLDPSDREAFFAVAGRLNAYLSREVLEKLQTLSGTGNVFRMIRKAAALAPFQRTRLEEVESRFRRLAHLKPKEALLGLLDCVSYDKTIEFAARTQGYAPEFLEGLLDTLFVIAENQETLPGFLSRLDTLREVLETAKSTRNTATRLTLSTVHSAKGLEFDRVLLVDMVEGEFPSADTLQTGSAMEEERRLCYVAITRARHELVVMVPAKWGRQKAQPSRFIKEMEDATKHGIP